MTANLLTLNLNDRNSSQNIEFLESGGILFFPEHFYSAIDPSLLSEAILHKTHKNVGYDYKKNQLGAFNSTNGVSDSQLIQLMKGYAEFSRQLIETVLPSYIPSLQWGRTSFRPAEISGRVSSKRKDDTRLHVDSFSASPVNGLRILRVFCNINLQQKPRVWHVGEAFKTVVDQFAPRIPPYNKWGAQILKWVKVTKSLRSAYDHYMLHLHDGMKKDDYYQAQVHKTQIDFPALSSWIVFTDQVSHAALSGQHLLEQTFYLPVESMGRPELSPYHEWERRGVF